MSTSGRPTSHRPAHKDRSSQAEFNKRLLHLQRSEPVDSKELKRRLAGLIADAKDGITNDRKRNIFWEEDEPSTKLAPRQSTLNPLSVARSSMITGYQHREDRDLMSRVACALQVCREADPAKEEEEEVKRESAFSAREEFAEVTKAVARKSVVFTAAKVVDIEKPKMTSAHRPRACSLQGLPAVNEPVKKRAVNEAKPKPLCISPTGVNFATVDGQLPDTAPLSPLSEMFSELADSLQCNPIQAPGDPSTGLPSVDKSSPGVEAFRPLHKSKSQGQAEGWGVSKRNTMTRHSPWHKNVVGALNSYWTGRPLQEFMSNSDAPARAVASQSAEKTPYGANKLPAPTTGFGGSKRMQTLFGKRPKSLELVGTSVMDVGAKSVPEPFLPSPRHSASDLELSLLPGLFAAPLMDLSPYEEGANGSWSSDRGFSPIFDFQAGDATAARSSATSLDVGAELDGPSTSCIAADRAATMSPDSSRRRQPAHRPGFTPERFTDMRYATAAAEGAAQSVADAEHGSTPPNFSFPELSRRPTDDDDHIVSPVSSTGLSVFPDLSSSEPGSPRDAVAGEFDMARKATGAAQSGMGMGMALAPSRSFGKYLWAGEGHDRHDSTGFSAAQQYVRGSIDTEGARQRFEAIKQVQSAAMLSRTVSDELADSHSQIVLTTGESDEKQWQQIAEGIAMIDSSFDTPPTERIACVEESYSVGPASREYPMAWPIDERLAQRTKQHAQPTDTTTNEARSFSSSEPSSTLHRGAVSRDIINTLCSSKPDHRARPLISEHALPADSQAFPRDRPRTARSAVDPHPLPINPGKIPFRIEFPPRANQTELAFMSPECLKLLHQQEALLRKRYEEVLNPIDSALKKPARSALGETENPTLSAMQAAMGPLRRQKSVLDIFTRAGSTRPEAWGKNEGPAADVRDSYAIFGASSIATQASRSEVALANCGESASGRKTPKWNLKFWKAY